MPRVKKVIKKIMGDKNWKRLALSKKIYIKGKNCSKKEFIKIIFKTKVEKKYNNLFENINLKEQKYKYFYYSIDQYKTLYYSGNIIANLMLDYNKILTNSFEDYKKDIKLVDEKQCIDAIYKLLDREKNYVKDEIIQESLEGLKNRQANSFRDALQRILFLNQLMWQTGHYLNGLGRLDKILIKYYENDIANKIISREDAKMMINEFLEILHEDYYFKSNSLDGDTGQIIILGGVDENKKYICNELTHLFLEAVREMQEPDPKILLRVNKDTPKELMKESLDCIKTGIGCPLFANDDIIIPKLIEFGIEENDAYNYGTAACWEPFITGKSFDQNNLKSISFMKPLEDLLNNEDLIKFSSTNDIVEYYFKYLNKYLEEFRRKIDAIKFGRDSLLSIFTDDCIKNEKDISQGGAKYNNYGFTGVGLSNLVNSILMIEKYVFEEKKYTLEDFNTIRKNNYEGNENLRKEIRENKNKYGKDDDKIIELTNRIIRETSKYFMGKKNPLGGKYKFGLSAPSYIDEAKNFPSSFDGRRKGDPFGVHISSDTANGYTELVQFASKLDYGENRFNGNVIDFYVSPNFIEDNYNKFLDFLIISIKIGFFEMQMNVVSSEQLIKARENPEEFPNLIVRVWGFSAYFKDLPDEYKDYVIERALKSEGKIK